MRKKTLRTRIMCALLALVFLASLFEVPILPSVEAANTATIPITVGGKTFNVTPGQWVTVNTPGGSTSYNVRFVDGKPVALEMSQYQQIIFGDAASSGAAAQTGSTGSASGNSGTVSTPSSGSNSSSAAQTSKPTSSSKPSSSSKPANSGSSSSAAQTSTPASSNGGQMTWNEFQKANAGKGMSNAEMGQAWKDYKAANGTGAGSTNSGAAQTSTNTGSTNTTQAAQTSGATAQTGNTPAPQTSVAEGAATTGATGTGGTQASSPSSSSSQTSQSSQTTKTWDPTKHPRDPQTGKFISHEEAIARGLMDPADANVSSSSSSQSSQTTQAGGEAAQASTADGSTGVAESGASSQSAQAAQATEGATAAEGKTKPSIGDKFKNGYQTGKNLTNQGFQNVKDSLKSGFSVKNILVTAGITVGVDLATQIMRGENPSLKTALKTVCSAEFVGGIAGSTLGCAAGSFFTPFLSCIPVVGGVLSALAPTFGSVVGSSVGAYVAGDLKNGRFSIKEAFKRVDWVGVTGQTIGSVVGGALGSCLGPVGGVIGSFAGGMLGNWAAHKIAGLFGKGDANLPTISMPTGTTSSGVGTVSSISLGGSDVTSVTISDAVVPEVEEEEQTRESVEASDVDAQITQAYEDYTALYTEYSQLIQAGKTNEAMEVAQKMNEAKAKYDNLRYK